MSVARLEAGGFSPLTDLVNCKGVKGGMLWGVGGTVRLGPAPGPSGNGVEGLMRGADLGVR